MRVHTQSGRRVVVPEAFLHDLRVLAVHQQVGRVAVPQVVEPDLRQAGLRGHPAKVPADYVVQVQRLAVRLAENPSNGRSNLPCIGRIPDSQR